MQNKNVVKLFPVPLAGKVTRRAVREGHKGFTLIELLVVVLIIGILAAVAVPQYTKAVEKARMAELFTNFPVIEKNIELFVLQEGMKSNVVLIGTPGYNQTAAEIEIPIDCSPTNDYGCASQYFIYSAWCEYDHCSWSAASNKEPEEGRIQAGGSFDGSAWSRYCHYESDLGEYLCNSLAGNGFDDISEGF